MKIGAILQEFCEVTGADPEAVAKRWNGRPDHIIEDLFRLPDADGQLHPVTLFDPWQRQFVHAYFYGDASVITLLKGRRIGGTAIALICMALEAIVRPNQLYPIVSTKEDQSHSRISDLTDLFENAVIEVPLPTKNKGDLELWNGTKFVGYTGAPDSSRGDGARSILFDEMAFMEKQKEKLRAYRPMMSLSTGKMLQVSTPNGKSDEFMKSFKRGSLSGFDEEGTKLGVISMFQPTFHNHDEIDIEVPLYEQELAPARPDLNIDVVEQDRAQDPVGFAQEYLCVPAAEESLFFSEPSVEAAMRIPQGNESYISGIAAPRMGGTRFMGVDVGYTHDDTVISVFDAWEDEKVGVERRSQRYLEVVSTKTISALGIADPDRENVNHVAARVSHVFDSLDCDYLIMDVTGSGQTLPALLRKKLGSAVIPFNFSDTKKVRDMFYAMNAGLRQGTVALLPDETLFEQLVAIQRIQKKDHLVPRFSGKDTAPEGKDDVAIATVLSAFPPGFDTPPARSVAAKEYPQVDRSRKVVDYDRDTRGSERPVAFASQKVNRPTGRRSYRSRYGRR
ncbi:terminase large subunit domain-containing protein [Halobellus limi]|uniref:Terminase-like family protein n=1 Tax=Halobellus limi TaxID=699433 RepID=A0A1H5ZIR9_9EURY|nr:terminase family protein [Halobellus limi]QCC48097.1 hypothetical protein DV707_10735 [Halobellus limi]SEG35665.1 Terminase-like family protein [Halobellus limi]